MSSIPQRWRGGAGTRAADVEDRLRIAEHVHALVRFAHQSELSDGSLSLVYRFGHVLYQDALLASIAPSRRVEWARMIAEARSVVRGHH